MEEETMRACDLCLRDEDVKEQPVGAVAEVEIRVENTVYENLTDAESKAAWKAIEKSSAYGTMTWDLCARHLRMVKDEKAAGELLASEA
jgi:hypothetical protein